MRKPWNSTGSYSRARTHEGGSEARLRSYPRLSCAALQSKSLSPYEVEVDGRMDGDRKMTIARKAV